MEWIGTRIRRERRRLGLSLDELASRTKMSKTYLSLLETGRMRNPPTDAKLRTLARVLGLAPDVLLTHGQLQRTPPEVRLVLEQLMAGDGVDGSTNRAMQEILRLPGKSEA